MSVTISAVPYLLISDLAHGIINVVNSMQTDKNLNLRGDILHLEEEEIQQLFNKKFETSIIDKDVLVKTLTEHGAINIVENGNLINCDCDVFHLQFEKQENLPYFLTIEYKKEDNLNELVENISSEYATNAQEISYKKIKKRLEEQNLNIYEEEIYDDNTIVLTVNLE